MTYILVFLTVWAAFILFADKTKFYRLFPIMLFAMVMSLSSDWIISNYPLWTYHDNDTHIPRLVIGLLDDFGIYPVIAYLYVQSLPLRLKQWIIYTFIWTLAGIGAEYILNVQGYMTYHLWWNLACSYCADWAIFFILTKATLWIQKLQQHPTIELTGRGKAHIVYEADIQALPDDHPLHFIPNYSGLEFYQSTSSDNVESYIYILEPKAAVPTHKHGGYEIHYLVEGSAIITVNGKDALCKQGDLIHFSSMLPHAFQNPGSTPAKFISIVMVSLPNFEPMKVPAQISQQSS